MTPEDPIPPAHQRTAALLGETALRALQNCHILVVGLGAVGGACVEALARSGVGRLTLVDGDCFEESNLNRQPFATQSVLGKAKSDVTAEALADIAPECKTTGIKTRLTPDDILPLLDETQPDCVVDAIDDVSAKVALLAGCVSRNLAVWSAMGAARKVDPTQFKVTDISKTAVCPLARIVRQRLRSQGVTRGIRCVWSTELPAPHTEGTLGSFMPATATAGLLLAADLILNLPRK